MSRMIAFLFLLLAAVPALAQDAVTPSDRVRTHVNVRATAAEDGAVVGQLNIGQALTLVASVPRWHQVQLAGGQTGFASKSWTTISRALLPREANELRIHFLNTGEGSCAVVECPGSNARPMIVDCG